MMAMRDHFPAKSRVIGYIFVDADGNLSVTPTPSLAGRSCFSF